MKSLTQCFIVATCMVSGTAFAQSEPTVPPMIDGECSTDADCGEDWSCETTEIGVCSSCAVGEPCDPSCTTETYSYCTPPPPTPCTADSDCSGSDVCVSYIYDVCSGTDTPAMTCASDEPCEAPVQDPVECTSQTTAYCVPAYVAPCEVDADCGAGFTCEQSEVCGCSDSPDRDEADPDAPVGFPETPVEEPTCSCAPSGDFYCKIIEVECDTDTDCASGLKCMDVYASGGTTVDPEAVPPAEGSGGATGSGDAPTPTPDPAAEATRYCAPSGYGYWGGPSSSGDVVANEAGIGSNAELSGSDRVSWGPGASDSSSKGDTSGCSTTGGEASLTFLGLVGLFGFLRRR